MSAADVPDLAGYLVGPEEFEREYRRLCEREGVDPDRFRARWAAGEVDPDTGYDPASEYYGKDVASLAMFLDEPPSIKELG
jgi:hypothetical protein